MRTRPRRLRARRGSSIVEVLVGIVLLSIALIGLAGSVALGMAQTGAAKRDLQYSADVQQVVDSLVAVGYGNTTTGSETIRGRAMSWTVAAPNAKTQLLTVFVPRISDRYRRVTVTDTVLVYLASTTP